MKKIWEKPVLIMLCRGTPDESILGQCKTFAGDPIGADIENRGCDTKASCLGSCEGETTS